MVDEMVSLVRWYAFLVWTLVVLETWRGLPGPWWVKGLLVVICLAIPGPQDEILLLAITAAARTWRARKGSSR